MLALASNVSIRRRRGLLFLVINFSSSIIISALYLLWKSKKCWKTSPRRVCVCNVIPWFIKSSCRSSVFSHTALFWRSDSKSGRRDISDIRTSVTSGDCQHWHWHCVIHLKSLNNFFWFSIFFIISICLLLQSLQLTNTFTLHGILTV